MSLFLFPSSCTDANGFVLAWGLEPLNGLAFLPPPGVKLPGVSWCILPPLDGLELPNRSHEMLLLLPFPCVAPTEGEGMLIDNPPDDTECALFCGLPDS